ncbi:transposase [Spirosoma gilvum]
MKALDTIQVITVQDKTVRAAPNDSTSTIALLGQILAANPGKPMIHIYCDWARYYISKQVADWIADKPIKLHFLPGYSPNLYPIKRLWKFMR